jgi:hypothetical protein
MKTLILITSMMALGMMGVGCSKSNSSSNSNNNNNGALNTPAPVVVDPNAPGGNPVTTINGGDTVAFTPVNLQTMSDYAMVPGSLTALNNPVDIKISLNLTQVVSGRYGGEITISYTDNGVAHSAVFNAGLGRNPIIKGGYDNDRLQADYNYWFNFENQLVFTAFFEDTYGAITVTLIPENPTGGGNDAEPLSVKYKGAIYFKNFKNGSSLVAKNNPYRPCWFIATGAFDCRSNIIQDKVGLAPGTEAGYVKLGTFTNVDIKKAFNIE